VVWFRVLRGFFRGGTLVKGKIWASHVFKLATHIFGAEGIPVSRLDLLPRVVLYMSRLALNEHTVYHIPRRFGKHFQIHAKADQRREIHALGRSQKVAVAQDPVGAADLVVKLGRILLEDLLPRVHLLIDDRSQNRGKPLDNLLFRLA